MISTAYAQAAAGAAEQPGALAQLMPLLVMFVVIFFLFIRPQMKRAKEHREMLSQLQKGDEVRTQGGIVGRIAELGENFVRVEVAEGVNIAMERHAIDRILPKGTLKNL